VEFLQRGQNTRVASISTPSGYDFIKWMIYLRVFLTLEATAEPDGAGWMPLKAIYSMVTLLDSLRIKVLTR
jgi:hypothetical protein